MLGGPDSWKGAPKSDGKDIACVCSTVWLVAGSYRCMQEHVSACMCTLFGFCHRLVMLLFILLLLLQQRVRNVGIIRPTSTRYR